MKICKILLCAVAFSFIAVSLWTGFLAITGIILMSFFTLEAATDIAIVIATILILIIFAILFKS